MGNSSSSTAFHSGGVVGELLNCSFCFSAFYMLF